MMCLKNSTSQKMKPSNLKDGWHDRLLALMDRVSRFRLDLFSLVQDDYTRPAGGCLPDTGALQHLLPGWNKLVNPLIRLFSNGKEPQRPKEALLSWRER